MRPLLFLLLAACAALPDDLSAADTAGFAPTLDERVADGGASLARSATQDARAAMVREMRYALSQARNNGQSNKSCAGWTAGDWNYVDDPDPASRQARDAVYGRYGAYYAGSPGYGPARDRCVGVSLGKGGQCKFFVDLMLRRGGGVVNGRARYELPSYAAMQLEAITSDLQPGDVIVKPSGPHVAMVYAILARDGSGRPTMVDVVDSNWISYEAIGKHKIESGDLASYRRLTNNNGVGGYVP